MHVHPMHKHMDMCKHTHDLKHILRSEGGLAQIEEKLGEWLDVIDIMWV